MPGGRNGRGGRCSRSRGGRIRCRRSVGHPALVPARRGGTAYLSCRGGTLRSGCGLLSTLGPHNVDDNDDADNEKDEANDEADEKSNRRIGGSGCGGSVRRRCCARARRGRGRHRGHAPRILQGIRRRRGTGISAGGERALHGDHLGHGVGPRGDGECAPSYVVADVEAPAVEDCTSPSTLRDRDLSVRSGWNNLRDSVSVRSA